MLGRPSEETSAAKSARSFSLARAAVSRTRPATASVATYAAEKGACDVVAPTTASATEVRTKPRITQRLSEGLSTGRLAKVDAEGWPTDEDSSDDDDARPSTSGMLE